MANPDASNSVTVGRKWQHISHLPENLEYDFSDIDALQRQWLAHRQSREAVDPEAYAQFLERLIRSWAIETGIIEGLYTLDRGVTETLVLHGISVDFIEQNASDKDPEDLIRTLTDHRDAAAGVYEEIRQGNQMSRSAIRQIHSVLTKNQPTYLAVDQFGREFHARLHHGAFKTLPNSPTTRAGVVHEYCPPEHVDSELDNLLAWYGQYQQDPERYHPILVGAWLHHRFTQIHPFEDGNGRVARALLAWHLIKAEYLPAVIKMSDRNLYFRALENADDGDLTPFVALLTRLQERTIFDALGRQTVVPVNATVTNEDLHGFGVIDAPELAEPSASLHQVLEHIAENINRQSALQEEQMRSVNALAEALRDHGVAVMQESAELIRSYMDHAGVRLSQFIDQGGPGNKEHWYHRQIIQTARNSQHWMNSNESRFFVKLSLTPDVESVYPRLVFVISLHHMGRQLTGIMAATAFALIGHYREDVTSTISEEDIYTFVDCTVDPFTFTWDNQIETLLRRFQSWAEQRLTIGLRQWAEYLV